jgi:hypothetical protein
VAEPSYSFQDPRQRRIYERLRLVGPGPAAFFLDACRLMEEVSSMATEAATFIAKEPQKVLDRRPTLSSTTHLVAHLLRDLESALTDVLASPDFEKRKGSDGHRQSIRSVLGNLGIEESEMAAQAWLDLPRSEFALNKMAHRQALERPRPVNKEFLELWDKMQMILDSVMDRFEANYLTTNETLDALLSKVTPTAEDAKTLRNRTPNYFVARFHFFEGLKNAAWLPLLRAEGFFRTPPEALVDPESGAVRFLTWPESQFLTRMADQDPGLVTEIVLEIPETDNGWVHYDILDIATRVPLPHAAAIAEKGRQWIEKQTHLWSNLPERAGDLICHLCELGAVQAALQLAKTLLEILPDPQAEEKRRSTESWAGKPDARARFDLYEYGQILEKCIPVLVQAADLQTISLLGDLLETAIRNSRRRSDDTEDYSSIWRPAIENHGQNSLNDLEDYLVTGVRDACEIACKKDRARLVPVIDHLDARPGTVFKRIALHLLRLYGDAALERVAQNLTDKALFDSSRVHHEYFLLSRDRFSQLSANDKAQILSWVEEGPDLEEYRRWYSKDGSEPPSEEIVARYKRRWQFEKLFPIAGSLPADWPQRFESLKAEFGEPDHPDFQSYIEGGWVGPTSPKSLDELGQMSPRELRQFLLTWKPEGGWRSATPEGLGRQLAEAIGLNPAPYAVDSHEFQGLDPTYVRAVIEGFQTAAKKDLAFQWAPVLSLCQWVLDQPREIENRSARLGDADPDWGWTRKAIARLLWAGLEEGPAEIPFELRKVVWSVLRPITEDPEPRPEDDQKLGDDKYFLGEPMTASINTVRGVAMHAAVAYAIWAQRNWRRQSPEATSSDFSQMPEVRDVLDRHLDTTLDKSPTIRAVYGHWFPSLLFLDRSWTVQNIGRIFPREPENRHLRDAAWETYLQSNKAYDNVFEVLQGEYREAVDRIHAERAEKPSLRDPEARLGQHLAVYYWRGQENLDNLGSMISRFFTSAPASLRGHVIGFVGHSLNKGEGEIPPEVLRRLQRLWESRVKAAQQSESPIANAEELAEFGWWFGSGKFEAEWAINRLEETLQIARKAEPEHLVMEQLEKIAGQYPRAAVRCFALLVEGDKQGWRTLYRDQNVRNILKAGLDSNGEEAQRAARELINRLAARGFTRFRDLLGS